MTPTEFVNNETLSFQPGQLIVVSGPDNAAVISMLVDARNAMNGVGKPCLDPVDTRMTVFYPDGLILGGAVPTTTQFQTHSYVKLFESLAPSGLPSVQVTIVSGANFGVTTGVVKYDRASGLMTVDPPLMAPPAVGDGFSIFPATEHALKFEWYAVTYQTSGTTPKVVLISNQFDLTDPKQNPFPADIDIDVVRDLLNLRNIENIPNAYNLNDGRYREIFGYISKLYYFDTRAGEITFIKNQIPERP